MSFRELLDSEFSELTEAPKQVKEKAQDALMSAAQSAFESYEAEDPEVFKEMDKQFARMEKLFGFKTGSWTRGV